MKRISIIGLAALFIVAFGAGQAFADAYNVTTSSGVRVTEKGTCEQVGATTMQGQDGVADIFHANQNITIELLAGATICSDIYAYYAYGGTNVAWAPGDPEPAPGADYLVIANAGDDYYTITVINDSTPVQQIRIGHDSFSRTCFDLVNTPYISTDPTLQKVEVTYRDDRSPQSTFTGDFVVATVKPKTITVTRCTKAEGGTGVEGPIARGWSVFSNFTKNGLIEIPLCSEEAQDQAACGLNTAYNQVCIKLADLTSGAFPASTHQFTVGKTTGAKPGVGIAAVEMVYEDLVGNQVGILTSITKRVKSDGTEIPVPTADLQDWVDTSQITFTADTQGPGKYFIILTVAYDTCTASTGDWLVDVSGFRVPCGGSFSQADVAVANFVTCVGLVSSYQAVFPYAAQQTLGWYNGVVITNPNDAEITVVFRIYEVDGDEYSASVTVPAHGQVVGEATSVLNPQPVGGDPQFGDEPYWMIGSSNSPFYGTLFMGEGIQAFGYIAIMPTLVPAM